MINPRVCLFPEIPKCFHFQYFQGIATLLLKSQDIAFNGAAETNGSRRDFKELTFYSVNNCLFYF